MPINKVRLVSIGKPALPASAMPALPALPASAMPASSSMKPKANLFGLK